MKRYTKLFLGLALALLCVFQFVGNDTVAYADDNTQIYWTAFTRDGNNDVIETGAISTDVTVQIGENELAGAASEASPSISDLKTNGLKVTVPEGHYVAEVVIADSTGTSYTIDADKNLLKYTAANTQNGNFSISGEEIVAAEAANENIDIIPTTTNNTDYCVLVSVAKIPDETAVLYDSGDVSLNGALVTGGNNFTLSTNKAHTVSALTDAQVQAAAAQNKKFLGWEIEYDNGAKGTIAAGANLNAYTNCTLTAQWGDLYYITVSTPDAEKTYDGVALTKDEHTIAVDQNLPENSSVEVDVTGTQTDAGSSMNTATVTIKTKSGDDITSSVKVTVKEGTLTVNKLVVTFTADSDTKTYDGNSLTKNSYTKSYNELPAGFTLATEPKVSGTITNAGTEDNVISGAVIKKGEDDVPETNIEIKYVNGTLTIEPIELEITADSAEKTYDGTPLTKNTWKLSKGTLPTGYTVDSVTVEGSITNVGTAKNTPKTVVIKKGDDVVDINNFEITLVEGTLTVNKLAIAFNAASDSKTYDGTALTKNSYTKSYDALPAGHTLTTEPTVSGTITDVGTKDNEISGAIIKNAANEDVTGNFDITYTNGTLTINPIEITITAASATKVHDGTALTKNGENDYTLTGPLLSDHKLKSLKITGSQTDVGEGNNVPSDAVIEDASGNNVTTNYKITYRNGKLTVTAERINITVTAKSAVKQYDGTPLTEDGYDLTGTLLSGHTLEVTINSTITNAGTVDNEITLVKVKNCDADVTAQYNITPVDGKLTVSPIPLVVTAKSGEKVYDGKALVVNSCTVSGKLLKILDTDGTTVKEQHTVTSVTVTGSQTKVGTSDNVPSSAVIKNKAGQDVTANYAIEYKNGTLTVKEATAKPTTGDSNNPGLWIGLMAGSLVLVGAAVALVYINKKRKNSSN